jgi:DNA repair protein SbcD/Mre11
VEESDLKILHFADLHLGVESGGRLHPGTGLNQRVVDVCDRLDELCRAVEEEGIHAVLFAGDAFKNQHPTPTLQSLFAKAIRRLRRAGAAVFLLIGNHDLPRMGGLAHPFSIYEALEVEGVVIGDKAQMYRLPLSPGAPAPELQVAALPHFSLHNALALADAAIEDPKDWVQGLVASAVLKLGSEIDPTRPAVFVGHCHVNQARIGESQNMFGISDIEIVLSTLTSTQAFPYYALGHLHTTQVLSEDPFVAYSGSLDRVDFSEGEVVDVSATGSVKRKEAERKGFYVARLATGDNGWRLADPPEFRAVNARGFVTLRLGELTGDDPLEEVHRRIDAARAAGVELDDAFVRITATIDATDRQRLPVGAIRDLIEEAYVVRVALDTLDPPTTRDPRFAKQMSEIEALDRFLETRVAWASEKDELARLGRELIVEVDLR